MLKMLMDVIRRVGRRFSDAKLSRYFRLLVAGLLLCLGWASVAQAAIPASERQVLLDLYASTNGAGWTNKTNWNGGIGTECTWYGVACDGAQSHVTDIDLRNNLLVGTLPPSLSGLTALQGFFVGDGNLSRTSRNQKGCFLL